MPRFTEEREAMQEFYKIRFFEDGYPGRYEDGKLSVHPLYGAYVLGDYILQYQREPSEELYSAIQIVADASVGRMDEYHDALVFWYPGDLHVDRAFQPYYSALTQSYYARRLYEAYDITGDIHLKEASEKAFNSFLLPAETGGVYCTTDGMMA